jgi:hypothetical protein
MNYKDLKPVDFELIPKGKKISARVLELDKKKDFKTFIFSEKTNVYSCLLPVISNTPKLPEINGLNIQYQLFGEAGLEDKNYILLECHSKSYLSNYTEIIKEILSEYDNQDFELIKVINKVIAKWRYFLAKPYNQILSEDKIVGLIGELMFLSKLILIYNEDALNIWTANSGEEDFINLNKIIEVKTTLNEKHEHIINGIDQLLIKAGSEKQILSLLLTKSSNLNSISLPIIIKECADNFVEDPENFDLFYRKLSKRGYDLRDNSQYLEYSYILNRGGYFNVDSSFPKLTKAELASPLNSRISKIRYTVDMEGLSCKDFKTTDIKVII